ncbi:YqgE/AlgH family protein [Parvularcula sp. ZS-1/3]|uniref:UPF0301 protein HK107_09735 n=1 Tax=Parvularcula mediterranea TaxID=2732508 RepID=A0A7Y3RMA0_9PROT|nr:YqgE/AlgH family protein [Parvularcula mediterranea]NNU16600.1 YqgE/AlgH family protein [Parvularcula mediterranea]
MAQRTHPSIDLRSGLTGKMLVALPHLADTPFERSVCLICSHDEEHAFGVIVNKPMKGVSVAEMVQEMQIEATGEAVERPVQFGGPVDLQRGAVVHTLDYREEDTVIVTPEIGLTATKDALELICGKSTPPEKWLLIMGHAGWDGGQLEDEIKRNDWLSLDATASLVFGQTSKTWDQAMATLGVSDLGQFDGNESPMIRPN